MLMIKPGIAYLDIVRQTRDQFPDIPLFIYQVSGEYAMLWYGAANGAVNLNATLMETLKSMRRAGESINGITETKMGQFLTSISFAFKGGDVIITYFTPLVLDILRGEQ